MIWEDKLVFITQQGPIFYAAIASVALGVTLMLVSIFLSLRGLRTGRAGAHWRALGRLFSQRGSLPGKSGPNRVRATDIGYQAHTPGGATPGIVPSAPALNGERMTELLARLKVAADRLEALGQDRENEYGFEPISSLKGMGSAVEYLQKTQAI